MHEIVTVDGVTRQFLALMVLTPVAGLATLMVFHARRLDRRRGILTGFLVGLCGPANWLLWQLYNSLTDRNGLDTTRNFGVNLAVFLLIGLGIGLALGRLPMPAVTEAEPAPTQSEEPE